MVLGLVVCLLPNVSRGVIVDVEEGVLMMRGDANGDDVVNMSDPMAIQNFLFQGTFTPPCVQACDANADGWVNNSDAAFLLNFLFMGGPAPPAPGPYQCGEAAPAPYLSCAHPTCEG
jgi:hypothetical protein